MAKSEALKRGKNLQAFPLEFNHGGLFMTCCKWNIHLMSMIYWLIVIFAIRSSYSSNAPNVEVEALADLKGALNDSDHRITDWDVDLVTPCFSWSHVICRNGNVISLNLDSNGLSGNISSSITKLKSLVTLELQNNNLHGEFPDFLASMGNLQNLNLANNNFNGSIPISWGQLSNLKHLILRGNMISGNVPEALANITGLKELDLSSNYLTGEIPARLFSVPTFNFTGTHLICGSSVDQPCVSKSPIPVSTSKSKFGVAVTSVSCSVFILLSIGIIFAYRLHQMRKVKDGVFVDVPGECEWKIPFAQIRRFSLQEVQLATDNFSESNIIGQGGFGKVYRGVLLDGTKVAVKCLSDYYSPGGEAAFQMEVEFTSIASHKNLLRLIGYCTTLSVKILIYPYMKNLSVYSHLRDLKPGEKGLDWPMRKRIAFGAAQGLEYLHDHCNPRIIHRDLKAANILLDDNFEAVLGGFGLAKLVDMNRTHVTTQVRGTIGHIAPEYLSTGKSSEKTDVFGYGITLLELVIGQRSVDFTQLEDEEDVLLLDHVKKLLREDRLEDIVDKNLTDYDLKEVQTITQVALLCTQSSPEGRPAMSEVVKMLQGDSLSERCAQWEC